MPSQKQNYKKVSLCRIFFIIQVTQQMQPLNVLGNNATLVQISQTVVQIRNIFYHMQLKLPSAFQKVLSCHKSYQLLFIKKFLWAQKDIKVKITPHTRRDFIVYKSQILSYFTAKLYTWEILPLHIPFNPFALKAIAFLLTNSLSSRLTHITSPLSPPLSAPGQAFSPLDKLTVHFVLPPVGAPLPTHTRW